MTAEWNPTTEDGKKLKEALLKFSASSDRVMLTPAKQQEKDKQEEKFLLQGRSYFDLKAYVMAGKSLPKTEEAFDKEITAESFGRLNEIDPDIHGKTRKTLTRVATDCSNFYDNDLHKMAQAGSVAVMWTDYLLENLREGSGIALFEQFAIILDDEKYKTKADFDDDFKSAVDAAQGILDLLIEEAEENQKKADAIVDVLKKFRDNINEVLPDVNFLIQQYDKGPAVNKSKQEKPYLEFLRADYKKNSDAAFDKLSKHNSTKEDWKTYTGVAIGLGLTVGRVPMWGWIALTYTSYKAEDLRKAYSTLWQEYEALQKENAREFKLITWIDGMLKQFRGVQEKINKAVEAVGVLAEMFDEQKKSFDSIRKSLKGIEKWAASPDAKNRRVFTEKLMEATIIKLESFQKAATGFAKTILTEVDDAFGTKGEKQVEKIVEETKEKK